MKRGKKMFIIILSTLGLLALITWGAIAYLGRSQTLSIKSIENPRGDLYLIHITKPSHQTWKAGAFAKFTLPDTSSAAMKNEAKGEQTSRWLTLASTPDEDEILIVTHNSGSVFKETLTHLPAGSKIEMSWLESSLSVKDNDQALVCFASDVGISTLRPVVKEWAGKRSIILNHLDKGVNIFDNELRELSKNNPNLTYKTSETFSQSQAFLKNAVVKYGNQAIYLLTGQPDDINEMKNFLKENGIDAKQIQTSMFRGLK
ncbi:ferredoxin reductase [Streptococcus gwangjuensis]|uniref:Ferredoxin reductase n=1 Tax=Streptococcus gwangjuensis TaxID=1433513 RepID=A0A387B1Q4_9STRE|nr:ferredoxin reductase [Streptococcus gwangjuense]AYF95209.1 ferredoxin reductase [Streptococcus gwangjuense]